MPVRYEFDPHQRLPLFYLSMKLNPYCLVLVNSKIGLGHDLHKRKS